MNKWIFLDLDEFLNTYESVFQKFSIEISDDIANISSGSGQIVFLRLHSDHSLIQDVLEILGPDDLLCLAFASEAEVNHALTEIDDDHGPILTYLDLNWDEGHIESFLRNHVKLSSALGDKDLELFEYERIDQNLGSLIGKVQGQLDRVKQIHEKSVPKKTKTFNGITFRSKYMAGVSGGGEFIEYEQIGHHIFFVLYNSSSYMGTASVLPIISEILSLETLENLDLRVWGDRIEASNEDKIKQGYVLGSIDIHSLKMEVLALGENLLLHNDRIINTLDKEGIIEFTLRRGESFFLTSSGLIQNYQKTFKQDHLISLLNKFADKAPNDFIEGLFKNLKKQTDEKFLSFDSSVLHIEVGNDVIVQV